MLAANDLDEVRGLIVGGEPGGDGVRVIVPVLLERAVDGLELLGGEGNVVEASILAKPGESGRILVAGTCSPDWTAMFANVLGDLQGEPSAGLPAPLGLYVCALDICLRCCKEGVGGNGDVGDGMGHCRVGLRLELLPSESPLSFMPLNCGVGGQPGHAGLESTPETSDPSTKACAVCAAAECSEASETKADDPHDAGSGPSSLLTNVIFSGAQASSMVGRWSRSDFDVLFGTFRAAVASTDDRWAGMAGKGVVGPLRVPRDDILSGHHPLPLCAPAGEVAAVVI